MPSPFPALVHNSTLTFAAETGELVTDIDTGNQYPQRASTDIICYLKEDSKPKALYYPGIDASEQLFEGYCVNPMTLPPGVNHGDVATATINGTEGTFVLEESVGQLELVKQIAGAKIRGEFRRNE